MCEEGIDEKKEEEYLNRRLKRRKERRFLEEESVRDKMREDNGTTEEIEAWPIYASSFTNSTPFPLALLLPFLSLSSDFSFFFSLNLLPRSIVLGLPFSIHNLFIYHIICFIK